MSGTSHPRWGGSADIGPAGETVSALGPGARRVGFHAVAIAGALATAVAGAIAAGSPDSSHSDLAAFARAAMVAAPIGAGLFVRRYESTRRFGTLLVAAGFGSFLTTLAESSNSWIYSTGRVAGWIVEPGIVFLVLSFPTGRLRGRTDGVLVWASALIVACLFLPTALLVERYPAPSQWTSCGPATCPRNAFMVVDRTPAFVADVVVPTREVFTALVFGLVAVRLARRLRWSRHLTRRAIAPVLVVAIVRESAFVVGFPLRRLAPHSELVWLAVWTLALALPALAVAFLVGIWRWRLFMTGAVHELAIRLQRHHGPEELREALVEAFEDDSLEIVYRMPDNGEWADAAGHKVRPPAATGGRAVTEVKDGDRTVAAIIHDAALRDESEFTDSASAYALMTLENQQLTVQTARLLREVQESRARIQTSADEERRRIEHDLHDGAQQRLVALRIKLELAAERVAGGEVGPAELRGLGQEVEAALDEVRSLARGIYPAPLADRGLVEALRSAALHSALPATVLAAGVRRYSRAIETAAYFCCLEALQNAAKHAEGASAVVIELSDNGSLHLDVRDDGAGFNPERVGGIGLAGMRDRIAAVGGKLAITSHPGRGTRVNATIPVPWPRQ